MFGFKWLQVHVNTLYRETKLIWCFSVLVLTGHCCLQGCIICQGSECTSYSWWWYFILWAYCEGFVTGGINCYDGQFLGWQPWGSWGLWIQGIHWYILAFCNRVNKFECPVVMRAQVTNPHIRDTFDDENCNHVHANIHSICPLQLKRSLNGHIVVQYFSVLRCHEV